MVPHHAQTYDVANSWRIRVFDMPASTSCDVDKGHNPGTNAIQAAGFEKDIACRITERTATLNECEGAPGRATLNGYMTRIEPFNAYRYTTVAGPIEKLVTQPYDKISPAMQERYLSLSPHNLVRVILGQRLQDDTDRENVYTRAQRWFQDWIGSGILAPDPQPSLYAYTQEFTPP